MTDLRYPGEIDSLSDLCDAFEWVESQGFVEAISAGDHSVGTTLEVMLNHALDADSSADFGFTELKVQRYGTSSKTSLFTKEPNYNDGWSMVEILTNYGYTDNEGRTAWKDRLYSYVNKGLYLNVNEDNELELCSEDGDVIGFWTEDMLQDGLEKISDICYVTAEVEWRDGTEYFHYNSFSRCTLDSDTFAILNSLDDGSLHLEIRAHLNSPTNARNRGTAFRTSNLYNISAFNIQDL